MSVKKRMTAFKIVTTELHCKLFFAPVQVTVLIVNL